MGEPVITSSFARGGPLELRTDVCVVGSGAGGGVAAAMFAEAGREVVVLEEGTWVEGGAMTQREEREYPRLYRDGGQQYTSDGGISVLQGRTLGGSTVINMADVVGVPDEVLRHWSSRYGLTRYGVDEVREAARACAAVIGANTIQRSTLNRNNALLVDAGERLGIRGGTFEHNRVGCVGSGYCLIGCAYDAKQSVAITWLPRAFQTRSCQAFTDARIERFETDGGRVVAAVGAVIDPATHQPVAPLRVAADHFVLAAGAIHSPLLLLASGLGGPRVGLDLSLQPQAPVTALMPEEVRLYRGVPQAGHLDGFETHTEEGGLGGFRLEGVSSTPGMSAASVPLWGAELHRFMARYNHVAALLALVPDRPSGRVSRRDDGRPRIDYTLSPAWQATLRQAVRTAAEVYLEAGAEAVLLPFVGSTPVRAKADLDQLAGLPVRAGSLTLISAHPQGTCRMGPEPSSSVVDLDGTVHGVENLQVLDASIFPTTASSHTMLPVMTWALLGARDRA